MSRWVRPPRAPVSLVAGALTALIMFELLTPIGVSGYATLVVSFASGVTGGRVLGHDGRRAAIGALLPLMLLAPQVVADTELTQILILAVAALGLNILTGWAGQLNLAQGIFVGLGAYTTAILGTNHGWPVLITIPVAGVVAAVVGAILGVIALRFAGLYLAMLTTSVALVAPVLLKHFGSLTGGTEGISVDPVELPAALTYSISSTQFNYALALLVAVIAAALSWNILSRRTGRALSALRDSTPAAQGVGVDITRYKVLAFALSSFWAGAAGGLYAITVGFINPDSFGLIYGIQFLIMIVLGGVSTIAGAFIGAALVYELMTQVQSVGLPATIAGQDLALPQQAVAGVVLILLVVLVPRGVTGLLYHPPAWVALRLRPRRPHRAGTDTTGAGPSPLHAPRPSSSAPPAYHPLNKEHS